MSSRNRFVVSMWAIFALSLAACPDEEQAQTTDDVATDLASDAGTTADTSPDVGSADVAPDASGPTCTAPPVIQPDPPDSSQTHFALSMFHYNIQYVIGGLEFEGDDGEMVLFADQAIHEGWDNDKVEDWIVVETFEPILDIYAKHPTWRVTFEMQAYMVEVMAERHPTVLEKLRELSHTGQVELVSFHYADQLFLAYPREDMQRSIDRTKEIFEEHCLPLSGVVFNQEGQAGEGRQQMLVDNGYTIGVFPKNLWRYAQGEDVRWPYYSSRGGTMIVGPGSVNPASGVTVAWDFFDDGELAATMDLPPYAAAFTNAVPESLAEYEAKLAEREAQGYKLTHITDFVHQLEAMGVEKKPAPPLLDGTWQPPSTDSIHRWLGGRSEANVGDDEDNLVRAGNAEARMHVAAVQVLYEHADAEGLEVGPLYQRLRTLWEELWHAEVSDSSGVNPWRGEVVFGIRQNAKVLAAAAALRADLFALLGWAHAVVNLETRSAEEQVGIPGAPEPLLPATPPFDLVIKADGRDVTPSWFEVGPGHLQVKVPLPPVAVDETCLDCDYRQVIVGFPRSHDVIAYTPGLIEDEVVSYDFSEFTFLHPQVYLPLANGLIGIGPDTWVIKHVRHVHIAARIGPGHDDVAFVDDTIPEGEQVIWVFDVVTGDAATALAIANQINIHPVVFY